MIWTPLLFVAWQDPDTRAWFPVGMLTGNETGYGFEYLRGVLGARERGFSPLPDFPDPTRRYFQKDLFSLFRTRGLNPARPEYGDFLSWLDLKGPAPSPIEVLAVSGGRRATDRLQMFAPPKECGGGWYMARFFAHGSRYFRQEVLDLLEPEEALLPLLDVANPHDPQAVLLTTGASHREPRQPVGFLPRFLSSLVWATLDEGPEGPRANATSRCRAQVVKVNSSTDVPETYRLLCSLQVCLPTDKILGAPDFRSAAGATDIAEAFPSRRPA